MRIDLRLSTLAAGILFTLTVAAYSALSVRAGIPTPFGEVHGATTASSSAVNVTAFSLIYFRKPANMDEIALSLGAGATWDRSVTVAKIKRVLRNAGLRVSTAKNITFGKISGMLAKHPRAGLAIIYLNQLHLAGDRPRHYVALLKSGTRGIYVADPGAYMGWLSLDYLRAHLGPDLGRFCLFVQPVGAPRPLTAYALTAHREIVLNVGEIAAGPGMLKIPFLLRNTLGHPIGIGFAEGTCFCFKGAAIATGNHKIAPGDVGKVVLSFDRSAIGTGNIIREVLISFTGYRHHWLRVIVKCHITSTHAPIQLTWYPQAIGLGVVRKLGALDGQEFTVLTPKGVSLQRPVVSSNVIRVIHLQSADDQQRVDEFGRTAHEFVVDLSRLPVGPVDVKITIGTNDKYIPKIVIPITGQVER